MEAVGLEYDSKSDCWVLDPSVVFKRKASNPTSNHRSSKASIDTVSSPLALIPSSNCCSSLPPPLSLPQSNSCLPSFTYHNDSELKRKRNHGTFKKFLTRWWTCFKPRNHSRPARKGKQRRSPGGDASTMQSPQPRHSNYYSAMYTEEREEHLKAVIIYCRKSIDLKVEEDDHI